MGDANLVESFFYMLPITKYNFCHQYLVSGCFQKGDYQGKIFFDRVNKNAIFNKFKVTAKVIKMGAEVFDIIIDTVSTPYHLSIFYPRFFQRMFNKPMERLTLDVHHTVTGDNRALRLLTNYESMAVELELNPTHLTARIIKKDITYVEFTQEHKLVFNANKFFLTLKPTLHLHADSLIRKELCTFSTYTCFTDLVGDIHVKVVAKAERKVNTEVTIHKDTEEIYHLVISNKETPYKFTFNSPYVVPFLVDLEFHPVEKTLKLTTNIDTHENLMEVKPLGAEKFNVEFNHEVVAEFVAASKKVEILRTLRDGSVLKTMITWTGGDLCENTATVTMLHKDIPQVATIGWNIRQLAHMTATIDVVGKKAPMIGDFEFRRNFKWNDLDGHAFEIVWDGKTATNMMKSLATPIVTDAKITYNNG